LRSLPGTPINCSDGLAENFSFFCEKIIIAPVQADGQPAILNKAYNLADDLL
jgi:hypothetical protein